MSMGFPTRSYQNHPAQLQRLARKVKEALAIRCIFSLVDMITKAKFSNSPKDFKIRLFG